MSMSWADYMQWAGFFCILVGAWLCSSNMVQGATCTIVGTIFIAVWCLMVDPTPWGIFALQIVCMTIWIRNWLNA